MYKLYYATGTCALASHIALEEAGADYSAVRLDFKANQQQSPDYLKVNPKGRVPALVTDKGIITETPAILAFIAQSFPKAKLAPLDDPFAFAQVQSFNSYLCATVHVAHAHKGRGYRWASDESLFRRYEAHGAEEHGRLCRADREGNAEGAVGDGRAVHDLRSLSLHHRALARGRQRRSFDAAEGRRPHEEDGGAAGGKEGDGRAAGQGRLALQGGLAKHYPPLLFPLIEGGLRLIHSTLSSRDPEQHMSKDIFNPLTMMKPAGYSHVAKVTGGALVYIAGQVSADASGNPVGEGNLEAQAEQVFKNLKAAVEAAGGTMADIIKMNVYLVAEVGADEVPKFRSVRDRYVNVERPPASTLVVVTRLARPGWLIEIEAVAAIG